MEGCYLRFLIFIYYVVNYASSSRLKIFCPKNGDFEQKENFVFGVCRAYFLRADDFCFHGEIFNSFQINKYDFKNIAEIEKMLAELSFSI